MFLRNFLILLLPFISFGQIKEKLILSEKDSVITKSDYLIFNASGGYCAKIINDKGEYLYTYTDTLGPFASVSGMYGSYGDILTTSEFHSNPQSPLYYKNGDGASVYGPVQGYLASYTTTKTHNNIAIGVVYNDSAYYYINNKKIKTILKHEGLRNENLSNWCAFSSNGNSIYSTLSNGKYDVIANEKKIAALDDDINEPMINDIGYYTYGEGQKGKPGEKYDYMFFIHSPTVRIGPVRTLWYHYMNSEKGYFYTGDDNGPSYIAINNKLFKNLDNIANITLLGSKNYLFTCTQDSINKINVNGTFYSLPCENIMAPVIDEKGNFACFGVKDYYLYKYVNGKQLPEPLSRDGLRATPLYISPNGSTLHFFDNDETTRVYRDNDKLFDVGSDHFNLLPREEIFGYGNRNATYGHNIFYMQVGNEGYLVYDGKISKPMPIVKEKSFEDQGIGNIINGQMEDHGFYVIQKTGEKTFSININNKIYQSLENIDWLLSGSCYFTKEKLIFYVEKKNCIYQYTIEL